MSRHATPRTTNVARLVGVGLLVTGLTVGGGAYFLGDRISSGLSGSAEASDGAGTNCAGEPLKVVATPEIAGVVRDALDRVTRARPCDRFTVSEATSKSTAEGIRKGNAPDVWIPDSVSWVDQVGADAKDRVPGGSTGGPNDVTEGAKTWVSSGSIARTPVVLANPKEGKGHLDAQPASWAELVTKTPGLQMANPDDDIASRLAYYASRVNQPEAMTLDVGAHLIFASRFAKPSVDELFAKSVEGKDIAPFPATEQALAAFDAEHPSIFRAVIPKQGSPTLDYPWIPSPSLTDEQKAVAAGGFKAMQTPETLAALGAAGYRGIDNGGGPLIDGTKAPYFTNIAPPSAQQRLAAIEQWDVLRTDMRMLAVVDVSGSMAYPARNTRGLTRIKVAEDACVTALQMLPAGSEIGAWVFATNKGPKNQPWLPVADVERLDSTIEGKSYREHLIEVTRTVPKKYLGGDTALYDTTLAALKSMTDSYDRTYVNSVVIMTDGKNDNPAGGLSLNELLAQIKTTYDPKRPVRVITIGMGEADPTALAAIAKATGGTSYIADTPKDIERVFVQALLARKADVINQ
jgi:Ca-activated chloride channel family protein